LASLAAPNVVDAIVAELASGVERAVECWMSQIDDVLSDSHLTSLGRLQAVRQIVEQYKTLTGKTELKGRSRPGR
jgi:acetyl-CoA carboxylase alpha subunit